RCQDLRTQSRVTEKPPETLISGDTPQYPSPEANFSTKGRLVEDNGSYIFELFHYTHQVNMQSIGRDTSCSMQTRASFDT
ncbi:hypothetical protein GBAR_LOCUS8553, partial [Geodia barretti]